MFGCGNLRIGQTILSAGELNELPERGGSAAAGPCFRAENQAQVDPRVKGHDVQAADEALGCKAPPHCGLAASRTRSRQGRARPLEAAIRQRTRLGAWGLPLVRSGSSGVSPGPGAADTVGGDASSAASAAHARQQLEPASTDGLRAYAAKTRENADQLAAVLEDTATNGLPNRGVVGRREDAGAVCAASAT